MKEIWKDIEGYEGYYQVSNLGKVRTFNPDRKKDRLKTIITPNVIKSGYCYAHLYRNGDRKAKQIHRLVAEVFIPNPEKKPEPNHLDGNKENNRVSNLQWVTKSENRRHSFKIGLVGPENYSKLKRWQVIEIRRLYPIYNQHQLAKIFNIGQAQISRIVNHQNWIPIEKQLIFI